MAESTKQPKAMSSRLATMKFMQRASASPSSTPSTPSDPPSKRQRLSNGTFNSIPSSAAQREARLVEEAIAAEAKKREDALEREAADRGESKWYLSYKQPNTPGAESVLKVVSAGYSSLDGAGTTRGEDSDEELVEQARPKFVGRKSFGKFNKTVEKQQNPDLSSSDSDGDENEDSENNEDDEDESDDPTGAKAMITADRKEAGDKARAERKARKHAEKAEALRLADERRKKHVKLNKLTGISSGGGSGGGGGGSSGGKNITCHTCGQKGHIQRECPEQRRGGGGR
ncbi:hypothetical protein LTR86_003729 [Recurvomyces mirabilis]|nr:hypothetical protein LTR86_003729 [Recurvomyces mirabilis]